MAKQLKLWNGRSLLLRTQEDSRWDALGTNQAPHVYICAYSRADARRLIEEYCGRDIGDFEIKNYFSEGCWGNSMDGVVPERGLWLQFSPNTHDQPVKVV